MKPLIRIGLTALLARGSTPLLMMKAKNTTRKVLTFSLALFALASWLRAATGIGANGLPNVLIMGDSVSEGYTPIVEGILIHRANVYHPETPNGAGYQNCNGTTYGLQHIDQWLARRKYALIYFNFGLHDLKHVNPYTRRNSRKASDPQEAAPPQYRKNLKEIVAKLKATGAKLIFATTTPYPPHVGGPLRQMGQAQLYNSIAVKIMKENGIEIDDLYSFIKPQEARLQQPRGVHFNPYGNLVIAKHVAAKIVAALRR